MKITEKLEYLQNNHMGAWLKTRSEVREELSDRQSMFCVCRRLATGFHENGCRQFQNKVTNETVKRLSSLITK